MFKRLSYIVLMLYFLGIATGGLTTLLQCKTSADCVEPCEEEENNLLRTNLSLEEDVICHEIWFSPSQFEFSSQKSPVLYNRGFMDIPLTLVLPPPERA